VLEGAPFYADLSARDNLRVWGPLSGGVTRKRVEESLGLVGLAARAGDKVRSFSLGMKQRLALAAALMHDPELLILDEPTNGLDPAGMREFRDLFRELGRAGKTLFVSSHLLSEVQQMCDEVGILKEGRLIARGPVAELLRRGDSLEVDATNPDKAMLILEAQEWVRGITREDSRLFVETPRERAADVSRVLAEHQVYLRELRPRESSLEEFFLDVTGEGEKA
jgi:ABC-2 type transport system ATP-binding protein